MRTVTLEQRKINGVAVGHKRPSAGKGKGWSGLLLWVFIIWSFIFVVAPWLQRHFSSIGQLGDFIESSGIDAGAIYYTEVEAVGDADAAIRDTFRFYLDAKKK